MAQSGTRSTIAELERPLWRLCEKLARRLKENDLAAGGVVLKLKTTGFVTRTRNARLQSPTVLPDRLYELARSLLAREATGTAFRLIGIGANPLVPGADAEVDLVHEQPGPGTDFEVGRGNHNGPAYRSTGPVLTSVFAG